MQVAKTRAGAFDGREGIRRNGASRYCAIFEELLVVAFAHGAKKNEKWRPCKDYCSLNARTIPDCYLVKYPRFRAGFSGKEIFHHRFGADISPDPGGGERYPENRDNDIWDVRISIYVVRLAERGLDIPTFY